MSDGYIYCFSNQSMPGILKVGMTERSPDIRLNEANTSDTWRPPTPYKLEFAKKIKNPKEKETCLHKLLEQYTERINPRREFFKVTADEVKMFLNIMDGEMWVSLPLAKVIESDEEEDDKSQQIVKGCRDMSQCFTNGQRIRHTIGINKTWIGIYDSTENGIKYNGQILTLNKFVTSHYESERPDRVSNANAWKECECEVKNEPNKWISTYCLTV